MWQRGRGRIVGQFLLRWTELSRSQEDIWSFEWELWDWSTEEELDCGDHPPWGEVKIPAEPPRALPRHTHTHTHTEIRMWILCKITGNGKTITKKKKVSEWNRQTTDQRAVWFMWYFKRYVHKSSLKSNWKSMEKISVCPLKLIFHEITVQTSSVGFLQEHQYKALSL